MVASGKSLAGLPFLDLDRHGAATQAIHVHSTVVVCFVEASQPVHDASSVSFVQSNNALNRNVTIFSLVRQQPQRIDQVVTQLQRRCVHHWGPSLHWH